jgi:alkylation response protein AidB-like acyl-CoA dehydrogenase
MQDTVEGLQEIRELAGQFAAERLRPHVERWDHERALDSDVVAQLAELGFHGMLVPEANGGLGFGLPAFTAVLDEIAWGEPVAAWLLVASGALATALHRTGANHHAAMLEAIAAGERTGSIGLATGRGVQAVKADEGFLLGGSARWMLRNQDRDVMLVDARVGEVSHLFVCSADSGGVTSGSRETTMGLRAARIEAVDLHDVALAAAARISDAARAASAAVQRLGAAAIAVGIARAALDHARGYADVREQFGRRLRGFQGIRARLADMDTRVDAARALLNAAAADGAAAAAAKARLFASETAMWVSTQAVQIFGGYGYMRDYPVEKLMRDAKATEILTDTNEALRERIAGALYQD